MSEALTGASRRGPSLDPRRRYAAAPTSPSGRERPSGTGGATAPAANVHGSDTDRRKRTMVMLDEAALIAKLAKLEALYARPGTDGDRVAAGMARDRIRERLRELERVERPIEFRFTVQDNWSRSLLSALLRRYGISPYRYRGQRYTTIMAMATPTFVDETLWPQFEQAEAILRQYLQEVTDEVISKAISGDLTDVEERAKGAGPSPAAPVREQEKAAPQAERPQPPPRPGTDGRKVGRNERCPCGSGRKYKECCGANASASQG